ncbi:MULTISPECIES: hypothetical protein [Bacillaceae]|nr:MULTISPECIES: hypothetical protein [Bacillaceae]MCE4047343.1 hypothetical protein [Bacillus sp. Au-Bac7]MCM3030622.1 hypothetical protein [Niallia sp. MER 6]MDL0437143.1 hypothetical protein [Niallia sp. SS-2023]UPO86298.1 hypothetical protein L8T27_011820 [Niallia sp. Man26]
MHIKHIQSLVKTSLNKYSRKKKWPPFLKMCEVIMKDLMEKAILTD